MAGHNKWSSIKHRKGAQDKKKGKIFSKMNKEIFVAVKEGGSPYPENNPRLRMAIQNAKAYNMPKDNIERAIKKATGNDDSNYQEYIYEGYAPHGVAVIVDTLSDNPNRTTSNIRSYFSKHGGNMSTKGSVEFMFETKSVFRFPIPENIDQEEFTLEIIDAGAQDVEFEEGYVTISGEKEDFGSIQDKLDEKGIEPETAELQKVPTTTVDLDNEKFQKVMKLIDKLEDDEDVQKVFHNIEAKEEQIASYTES